MRVTPELIAQLEAELAQAEADLEQGKTCGLAGFAVLVLEHRVTETRLCLEHAREHAGQVLTGPQTSTARKGPARTRAELDQERLPHRVARRAELEARVTARETAGPVSTASNNWRHRQAAVDRHLAVMRQDRRDRAEIRRLTSLINRTERS